MFSKKNRSKGFSLIELMIVVVIIGILAALTIPCFMGMDVRIKQNEAPKMLTEIAIAEEEHYAKTGIFLNVGKTVGPGDSFGLLGITIPKDFHYSYTIEKDATTGGLLITAEGNIDDDATLDRWTKGVNSSKLPQNIVNDVTQ